MAQRFDIKKEEARIHEMRRREEEDLAALLSEKYNLPYTDLTIFPINTEGLALIPEKVAREAQVAVFGLSGKRVDVALLTPNNPHLKKIFDHLKEKGLLVRAYIVSQYSLEHAWKRYQEISQTKKVEEGVVEISNEKIEKLAKSLNTIDDVAVLVQKELSEKKLHTTSAILEIILAGALTQDVSDIHIEPEEKAVRLRFRLDGVLSDITTITPSVYAHLISRIKLISGLKLNIKTQAQDGRLSIKIGKDEIEIRTSVIPGNYGESAVLRILNPNTIALDVKALGMDDRMLSFMREAIIKPNGMLLNTGPTGSGKTTTLYSLLKEVNKPGIKIITIEDPIEYHLPGIIQTQVRKGYGFTEGLRSGLRQDPDIIMVGEIRDKDTAKTAAHAALTGHLVFSTLHTNNAAGTIPRLLDLGVDQKILSDALSLAMAQRLVRKLCAHCKKEYTPNAQEKEEIRKIVENFPPLYKKDVPDINSLKLFQSGGCTKCSNTGYKGRIGVFEIITMDEAVSHVVRENPGEREVRRAAKNQGFLEMKEDGILKVIAGTTDLSELKRVIDLEHE